MSESDALFEFLCRMGDSTLILSHRVSEWCGHAPVIEEDIALANTALDLIGQATLWLDLAGEVEGKGRDADALAYRRDVWDFRNLLLVERPNGNFGDTLMRQFLFDAQHKELLLRLSDSHNPEVAAIAKKASKEVAYHLERSALTVIGLGDGTNESHEKMQAALEAHWPYVGEMFQDDAADILLSDEGIAPRPSTLRDPWNEQIRDVLAKATLDIPASDFSHRGGRTGTHTEHLGYILADMQFLQRAYPDASW